MDILLLLLFLVLAFFVAFAAGANDEMMAPGVSSGVFSLRTAVYLGAVFSVLGAIFLSEAVSKTIGSDMIRNAPAGGLDDVMALAILLSMTVLLILISASEGLPISSTQAIVGAVIGVAFAAGFFKSGWGLFVIDWWVILNIFASWILSPVIGFFIAATLQFWIQRLDLVLQEKFEELTISQGYGYLLGIILIISESIRSGNDVANSIAPVLGLSLFNVPSSQLLPLLVGGIGMAIGLVIIGKKVIRLVAREIVDMDNASAFSAMTSVMLVMTVGTMLGLPLSGTHVLVAAMIAVGWAEQSQIQIDVIKKIGISWVITVPLAAVVSVIIYSGLFLLIPA